MKRWKGETQESYNIRRKAADEAMKERINTVKVLFGFGHSRGQAVYRKSEWKNGEYVGPERKPPRVKSASAARGTKANPPHNSRRGAGSSTRGKGLVKP